MTTTDPYAIDSLEKLRTIYGEPSPLVTKSKLDFLHDHMIDFIRYCPIVALASETEDGLDASPRGGEPGFVKVLDRKTVAIGDWPGNNKLESITNIIRTGRCGILFLVPKQDVFFRINGPASVTQDPDVLKKLVEHNKEPKAAIKVTVNEAYFHCGKAFRRSGLWKPEGWTDSSAFPMVGKVLKDLTDIAEYSPEQLEGLYQHGLKEELY
ncbi:MSMEG_1061 family FMN-dependent PPOX-type flavoprotein [Kordiimonas pumila]|uniref:MSMEG_1061 family FMN-dependent PPOX-type flavoprotein n=1 Tax=Kordiimonas pumila TaxID=2161677 RepID=A0ABV7D5D0_9PROT|nr:MSMEG_1061 family FMN-dependent PPOX-type flavoprotein [Kordiimonas pumila]